MGRSDASEGMQLSKEAEDVADALFDHLSKFAGSKGQPTVESCILAFIDKPGIATAFGFAEDICHPNHCISAEILRAGKKLKV